VLRSDGFQCSDRSGRWDWTARRLLSAKHESVDAIQCSLLEKCVSISDQARRAIFPNGEEVNLT